MKNLIRKILKEYEEENKILKFAQSTVNRTLNNLRKLADEEFGLGEMDEMDEINSVDEIIVKDVIIGDNSVVVLDLLKNSNRQDFDNLKAELWYDLDRYIPKVKIEMNVIDNRKFGPGIDW